MSTYAVVQDGPIFEVKAGDQNGPVVATFSNKLAAERYAEKLREAAASGAASAPPADKPV